MERRGDESGNQVVIALAFKPERRGFESISPVVMVSFYRFSPVPLHQCFSERPSTVCWCIILDLRFSFILDVCSSQFALYFWIFSSFGSAFSSLRMVVILILSALVYPLILFTNFIFDVRSLCRCPCFTQHCTTGTAKISYKRTCLLKLASFLTVFANIPHSLILN